MSFFGRSLLLVSLLLATEAVANTTTVLVYWAVDNDLYELSVPYLKQFEPLKNNPGFNMVLGCVYPDRRPTQR